MTDPCLPLGLCVQLQQDACDITRKSYAYDHIIFKKIGSSSSFEQLEVAFFLVQLFQVSQFQVFQLGQMHSGTWNCKKWLKWNKQTRAQPWPVVACQISSFSVPKSDVLWEREPVSVRSFSCLIALFLNIGLSDWTNNTWAQLVEVFEYFWRFLKGKRINMSRRQSAAAAAAASSIFIIIEKLLEF